MSNRNETPPLVVEVERSGLVESTHLVDVAVVDPGGALVAWAGDPQTVAYLRSSAKPVQAITCLELGWAPREERSVAIACASHNGEPAHLEAVRDVLAEAQLDESALRCPSSRPLRPEYASVASPAPIVHNCSGKHAAMLATSLANGWSLEDYLAPEHPLQRAVRERVERFAGATARAVGVDGCGAPTFALTLAEAARVFAAAEGTTADRAFSAMIENPFLVAGTGRVCTAILENVSGVVVKIGAEGIFCGCLLRDRTGFALKARDGAVRATETAAVSVIAMLGVVAEPVPEGLRAFVDPVVTGGGAPVGSLRCRGTLRLP